MKMWWFDGGLTSAAAPTLTELNGASGDDLLGAKGSEALADIRGFKPTSSVIPTDDFINTIAGNVGGTSQYPQSSLIFYSDPDDLTLHDLFTVGAVGEIVIGHLGATAAVSPSLVFDSTVLFNEYESAKGAATMYEVAFAISAPTPGTFQT